MRNTRKGFTLVELLIVVAILATLTATMMVSMRGATAKAKAASIAANLESCHTATLLYYAASGDKDLSKVDAEDMLTTNLKTWYKLKGGDGDSIKYTAVGEGSKYWSVNVDFSGDAEADDIARALHNMRGYDNVTVAFDGINVLDILLGANAAYAEGTSTKGKLYMNLITGKILAGETSDGTEIDDDTTYDKPAGTTTTNTDSDTDSDTGTGTE